jgi:hypothetical protein
MVTSRWMLLLDDLLWVLTVTQLKAAILYYNSLKEVIERSSQQSKRLAAEKLKVSNALTIHFYIHISQLNIHSMISVSKVSFRSFLLISGMSDGANNF